MSLILSRRKWINPLSLAGMGTALAPRLLRPSAQSDGGKDYKTYFGDLHNYNVIGYAQGSLERTFEIARNRLDFFAFTPHRNWHDIGTYENQIENMWTNGFAVTRADWRKAARRCLREISRKNPQWSTAWFRTSLPDLLHRGRP